MRWSLTNETTGHCYCNDQAGKTKRLKGKSGYCHYFNQASQAYCSYNRTNQAGRQETKNQCYCNGVSQAKSKQRKECHYYSN